SCPAPSPGSKVATCFNTAYTYFLTATDLVGTTSNDSSTASGEVDHLVHVFVIADSQTVIYGDRIPTLTFQVFGDGSALLDQSKVNCTISPVPVNVGNYAITCSGPPSPSPTVTFTYNAPYNDGVTVHMPGVLNIKPAPLTITAVTNTKTYDATTSAAAIPIVSG